MSVRIYLDLGHDASLRTKRTQEGFTHDWEVFVKGCDGAEIQHYVEKVVFYLHETFTKPKRVVKDPPYSLKESGYAGFVIGIDVYLKNKDEPKKIKFNYDLNLQTSGPPIQRIQREKYVFKDPNEEFRQRLLKGGGQCISTSSSNDLDSKSSTDKTQLLNKPKLGGTIDHKKPKKMDEPRETFRDLFGPPIKCTKTPEPKPTSGGGSSTSSGGSSTTTKDAIKKDKDKDKLSDKERKNKSPIKDRDKDKRDKDERKKDKSKERSKDHERSSKDKKRDKSPRRSLSPGSRRASSPKRLSPKRPSSPSESTKSKDDRKEEKDKEKRKDKEKEDSKKYKKRDKEKDKEKEKEYKEHKDKEFKKDLKPMVSLSTKEKEASPLPPPAVTTIKPEKKEKPKEIKPEIKPEAVEADKPKLTEEKKDKHKHKKKDKDRDKDKEKEKRDKTSHKSKEKKYEQSSNLFTNPTNQPMPPTLTQPLPPAAKHDKKKFDVDNENSNSSCISTNETEECKPPSPQLPPPVVQQPQPMIIQPPVPDPAKPKKDKTKKKERKLDKEEKRRRRRDLSPGEDEPITKTPKEERDASPPPAINQQMTLANNDGDAQENPEDYLRILQDLQHKIMSLQDNTELQKVVKLIAETGRYEVSARTFDFDLCLLERSTVRRLQEFFAVSS